MAHKSFSVCAKNGVFKFHYIAPPSPPPPLLLPTPLSASACTAHSRGRERERRISYAHQFPCWWWHRDRTHKRHSHFGLSYGRRNARKRKDEEATPPPPQQQEREKKNVPGSLKRMAIMQMECFPFNFFLSSSFWFLCVCVCVLCVVRCVQNGKFSWLASIGTFFSLVGPRRTRKLCTFECEHESMEMVIETAISPYQYQYIYIVKWNHIHRVVRSSLFTHSIHRSEWRQN